MFIYPYRREKGVGIQILHHTTYNLHLYKVPIDCPGLLIRFPGLQYPPSTEG